jgi:hypothetical protein
MIALLRIVLAALLAVACGDRRPGEETASEPSCARPGGYLRLLEFGKTPPGFRSGIDPVADPRAFDPRLTFRVVGEPAIEDGVLRLTAAIANPSGEEIDLDVINGGVAGLTSLPFALVLDPPPPLRPGLGYEQFSGPEVYPATVRWTMPPASEIRLTAHECLARYDLSDVTGLRVRYWLETPGDSKPEGAVEVTLPR